MLAKQAFVFRLCVMSLEKWRSEVGSADFWLNFMNIRSDSDMSCEQFYGMEICQQPVILWHRESWKFCGDYFCKSAKIWNCVCSVAKSVAVTHKTVHVSIQYYHPFASPISMSNMSSLDPKEWANMEDAIVSFHNIMFNGLQWPLLVWGWVWNRK